MKKFISIVMVLMVLALAATLVNGAAMADDSWVCPECGKTASGKFCANCGSPKPDDTEEWLCPNCNKPMKGNFCSICGAKKPSAEKSKNNNTANNSASGTEADKVNYSDGYFYGRKLNGDEYDICIKIEFERNLMFSTYGVTLFIDDIEIGNIPHGSKFEITAPLAAGKHTLTFYREDDRSIKGSVSFDVDRDDDFHCEIHTKHDYILVDHVWMESKAQGTAAVTR